MATPTPANYEEYPLVVDIVLELNELLPTCNDYFGGTILRMESEKFLSVISQGDTWTKPTALRVDLTDPASPKTTVVTYPKARTGDTIVAAVWSPTGEWCIQQNGEHRVWITNAEETVQLSPGKCVSQNSAVQLVTWVGATIAVITERQIIHLNLSGAVIRIMDLPGLFVRQCCVVDYKTSPDFQCTLATGINLKKDAISGYLLVYRLKDRVWFPIRGLAGDFLRSSCPTDGTRLIVARSGESSGSFIVGIVDLKGAIEKQELLCKDQIVVVLGQGGKDGEVDVPVSVKVSEKLHIAFVATKLGYLHLFDCIEWKYMGSKRISTQRLVAVVPHQETGGILTVDYTGKMQSAHLHPDTAQMFLYTESAEKSFFQKIIGSRATPSYVPESFLYKFLKIVAVNQKQAVSEAYDNLARLSVEESVNVLTACFKHGVASADILRLAVKFRPDIGAQPLIELYEKYSTPKGVLIFMNAMGACHLRGDQFRKFIKLIIEEDQYMSLVHLVTKLHLTEPGTIKAALLEADGIPSEMLIQLLEALSARYGISSAKHLAKLYQKTHRVDKIKGLVQMAGKSELLDITNGLLEENPSDKDLILCLTQARSAAFCMELFDLLISRNRSRPLEQLLELLVAKNDPTPAFSTTLLKLYIKHGDGNSIKVYKLIRENQYYDCLEIGKCFEAINPTIALMVYGKNSRDLEFIQVSNNNSLFELQVKHLLSRNQPKLWDQVFKESNLFRELLIDEIVAQLSPSGNELRLDFTPVSVVVNALVQSEHRTGSMRLLNCVLQCGFPEEQMKEFRNLYVAILKKGMSSPGSLEEYFTSQQQLFDHIILAEALIIANLTDLAVKVLTAGKSKLSDVEAVDKFSNGLERIHNVAERCDDYAVWNFFGKHFLESGKLFHCLRFFIKARNYTYYKDIQKLASADSSFVQWDTLITYFEGVKRATSDPSLNSAMAVILAKANRFEELEKHFNNVVDDSHGCKICEDGVKEITFNPCGHVVACAICAQLLKDCPVCRTTIVSKIRIFQS